MNMVLRRSDREITELIFSESQNAKEIAKLILSDVETFRLLKKEPKTLEEAIHRQFIDMVVSETIRVLRDATYVDKICLKELFYAENNVEDVKSAQGRCYGARGYLRDISWATEFYYAYQLIYKGRHEIPEVDLRRHLTQEFNGEIISPLQIFVGCVSEGDGEHCGIYVVAKHEGKDFVIEKLIPLAEYFRSVIQDRTAFKKV